MDAFANRQLRLLVLALVLVGCTSNRLAPAPPPGAQVDVFNQLPRAQSDILWIVENSLTMARVQDQFASSAHSFFVQLEDAGVDYRIAVTTADVFAQNGQLVGTPQIIAGNSSLDSGVPNTPNPETAFAANIHVGASGSPRDEAFEAASKALELLQASAGADEDAGQPVFFLRPNAGLFLIFAVDEYDYSPDYSLTGMQYYWRQYSQAKGIGNEGLVQVAAIAGYDGNPNLGCYIPACQPDGGNAFADGGDAGNADPDVRDVELVELANGFLGSICDCNFSSTLSQLGIEALGLQNSFILSQPANPASIQVVVTYPCSTPDPQDNLFCLPDSGIGSTCPSGVGTSCTASCNSFGLSCNMTPLDPDAGFLDGWTYDPSNSSITFTPSTQPGAGAQITVNYLVAGAAS